MPLEQAIGAGLQLVNSIYGGAVEFNNTKRADKYRNQDRNRERDWRYEDRQWSLDDWNRNNEYNSPASQMERFRKAGLNPNLMYGQMTNAQPVRGTSSSPNKTDAYKADASAAQNGLSNFAALMIETQNIQAQKDLIIAETEAQKWGVERGKSLLPVEREQMFRNIEKTDADTTKSIAEKDKTLQDAQYTIDQNKRAKEMQMENIKRIKAEIHQMDVHNAKTEVEKEHIRMLIKIAKSESKLKKFEVLLRSINVNPSSSDWVGTLATQLRTTGKSSYYYGKLYDIYNGED